MKMILKHFTIAALCFLGSQHLLAQTAYEQGKAFGTSQNSALESVVASDPLQKYGGVPVPPTETSSQAAREGLYQNGRGSLGNYGTDKFTACAAQPDDGSLAAKECAPINFIARNPTTRPVITVNNSTPIVQAGRSITQNEAASIDPKGQSTTLSNTYGACSTNTTSNNFSTSAVCHQFREQVFNTCPVGQQVVVNANTNYQCDATPKVQTSQSCNKTLTVSCIVQAGTCYTGPYVTTPRPVTGAFTFCPHWSFGRGVECGPLNSSGMLALAKPFCIAQGYEEVGVVSVVPDYSGVRKMEATCSGRAITACPSTCTDSWTNQCTTLEGRAL